MENLLIQLDEYIRKNGIPFRSIYVNLNYFPEYFNQAINREIKKIASDDCILDKEYKITYDENGNICLIATASKRNKKATKTILLLSNDINKINVPFPCTRMYWNKMFKRACSDKYLEKERAEIEKKIEKLNLSKAEKIKLLGEIMSIHTDSIASEMKKRDSSFAKELNARKEFQITLSNITNYIDYLNKEYVESTKLDTISYTPAEPEHIETEPKNYTGSSVAEERKNIILSVEDRQEVLKKIRSMYACLAQRSDTQSIGALCYLYNFGNGYYKMILEPYSGEGYTKVIAIHCEKEMDKELFKELTTKYLEYSNMETMQAENIARLGHTTIDTYNSAIGYALTGDSSLKISSYTKHNLDSIQPSEEYSYAL